MKQFAAWQAPFYSFWSKSFYVDVAKNWGGLAYGYLFAVVAFTWIFMAAKFQIDFNYVADRDYYPIVERMPKITIEKGVLSIDKPSPFNLTTVQGIPVVTFDTRDKPMTMDEAPSNFLVAKDGVYLRANPYADANDKRANSADASKDQKIDISTIDHQIIDKGVAKQFVSDTCKSIGLISFLIFVPLAFVFCVCQTLIYSLMALPIVKVNKVDLSYGTLIRLSAVALTPVLLIDSIVKVRGLQLNIGFAWSIIAFLIGIGYVIFAVSANIVNEDNKPELTNS